jgi:circadian clock protein KaiC
LLLRNLECNGERNRGLYVLKARGIAHSNQIREFLLTDHGVELVDVYLGPSGMLTGSARIAQDRRERPEAADQQQIERKKLQLTRKRLDLEAQIARMKAKFEAEQQSLLRELGRLEVADEGCAQAREEMRLARQPDVVSAPRNGHAQKAL